MGILDLIDRMDPGNRSGGKPGGGRTAPAGSCNDGKGGARTMEAAGNQ